MTAVSREPYDVDGLVDVAVRVFLDRGYDRASMGDVARAAGLGKSSLYHHVAGKEELLRRAVSRVGGNPTAPGAPEPAVTNGTPSGRLGVVIRRTVEIMCDRPAEVALLLRVRGNTEIERWAMQRRREFDRVVTALVEDAVDTGELRRDLDPALVTRLVFGMSNSVVEWYRPHGRTPPEQIVHAISAIVFNGLRATQTGDRP